MTTSRSISPWIWLHPDWPEGSLAYDDRAVALDLAEAYRMHGILEGKAAAIGIGRTSQVALDALSDEVLATAAIEGERLSLDAVRSSVMRRLGLSTSGPINRSVDGLVEVISDATTAIDAPLDEDRLCRWPRYSPAVRQASSESQLVAIGTTPILCKSSAANQAARLSTTRRRRRRTSPSR